MHYTKNQHVPKLLIMLFFVRYCFVEMAHDKGLLSSPEYAVMCQWYEFIEKNVDIGLDLIGWYIIFYTFIL